MKGRKKQVNLTQLITWVWENRKTDVFKSMDDGNIEMRIAGNIICIKCADDHPNFDSLFEIEDDIDEDTVLPKILEIYVRGSGSEGVMLHENISIRQIIEDTPENHKTTHIHYVHADGTMTLLWAEGRMIEDERQHQ